MSEQLQTIQSFHTVLDESAAHLWEAIYSLPFLTELSDSSLDERSFRYFIAQDLLYLDEFARVLAIGARMAETPETRQLFLQHAANVHVVEQSLHTTMAPRLGIDPGSIRQQEPKPVTLAYTDHLLKVAGSGTLLDLVAAVLPCYWVYHRVGERLIGSPPDHELYRNWVQSYASPDFADAVSAQLQLLNELADGADRRSLERAARWFNRSMRYEWMFWNQAYHRLDWPG